MLAQADLLAAFRRAVAARDPAAVVRDHMARIEPSPSNRPKRKLGIAAGKAALAMARGCGPVDDGVVIAPIGGELPAGWRYFAGAHPFPDQRSVAAAHAARAIVAAATPADRIYGFISGGASAMLEDPIDGLSIDELARITRAVMESGAPIEELNAVRSALSRVKSARLVRPSAAPVSTFVASDVIGDDYRVIGGGPTTLVDDDEPDRITLAREVLARIDMAESLAPLLDRAERVAREEVQTRLAAEERPRRRDSMCVLLPMRGFAEAIVAAIGTDTIGNMPTCPKHAWSDTVESLATHLVRMAIREGNAARFVAWGEPTLKVRAQHGEGGRMQHLALLIAKAIAGKPIIAMAIGSDGVDGPPPPNRPAPAGAIVDGATWEAIAHAGIGGDRAIEACDAGTALAAVDALVITGPTGINHGDVVVIGPRA